MAYATVEQFVARVTVLEAKALAPTSPIGGIDEVTLQDRIEDVSAEIDTYLAARYPTPLNPVPKIVSVAAIALAREALDRQGRDHVKAEAARVRGWLKDVSKGAANLGGGEVGEDTPAPAADAGPIYAGPDRVFDGDGLAAFLGRG